MSRFKGDEIVISGISGCFPDAEDTQQLSEKLYNKVDMVTKIEEYASYKNPKLPKYLGKIKNLEKFDSQFFKVSHAQAVTLDPLGRKLMEQAFSAVFDAGINPETLKGAKLGVFIGSTQTDAGNLCMFEYSKHNVFILSGCSKTMQANRISYWLDGKGPSYGFDQGCNGSSSALEMAYNRMKTGEIDCAIVGGCNICTHPFLNVNMKSAGLLCLDGKTKCFDKNGDGFVRSDAVNVYFLQKAKDAIRIYAEVYHVKGKFFAAPDASFSPARNPKDIETFFEEFYSEVDVTPKDVEYVEANAFGIAEADGNELEAIGNIFGKDKIQKIGSVKSNMGNTEAASGACSVTKMCLAYQKGVIPANLHFKEPQNNIPSVKEGRLQVVTEHAPFNRNFTAINNFCYTGSNFHVLLKGHYIKKDTDRYKSSIPRLVLVSGRTETSVNKMLDILEENPIDPEQLALFNNFFKYNMPGNTGRGYTVLDSDENQKTVSLAKSFELYSGNARPVWFLYSGMGSQWAGMGEELLRLPVFAAAIKRCHTVLSPKGLDIVKIITDKDSGSLNILNSLIAITAIQIGLTDVLKSLGIVPDNIIGHSVGEIGSAYGDESLSAEETILASYCRAIAAYKTQFVKGKMAAVGLGYKNIMKLCPPEIQVACHNSSESSTISGPFDIVTEFVKNLTDQGIFAKEVASSNIAFHSRYVAEIGPVVLKMLQQVIKKPKLRSKKWVSTCYLPEEWNKPESKYASAEYFTFNLLGSVLFEEATQFIPDDAIIIEIAPHGLLQAIMKRSHSQCINLSLTRRGEKDSVKLLLETIGKLHQFGLNVDLEALYPKVDFPVSTETSMLSHFVGWDHRENWNVYGFVMDESKPATCKEFNFSIHEEDYEFLKGYIRNGVNVLPEAAVLTFIWETLAMDKTVNHVNMGVVFKDIKFYREITINPEENLKLYVAIQKGSSKFEVTSDDNVVADGYIYKAKNADTKCGMILFGENETHLNQNDIYTILKMRGYSYEGELIQAIKSANIERNKATIKWNNHWICFLDSLIQFNDLSKNHDGVSIIKLIKKLTINVDEHIKYRLDTTDGVEYYNAVTLEEGCTKCGGIIFEDIIFDERPKIESSPQVLKTRQFVAHAPPFEVDMNTALQVNLQVLCENISSNEIKIKEVIRDKKFTISNELEKVAREIPLTTIKIETIDGICDDFVDETELSTTNVYIFQNFVRNYKLAEEIIGNISDDTYILALENEGIKEIDSKIGMKTITLMHVSNHTMVLMKKAKRFHFSKTNVIETHGENTLSGLQLKNKLIEHKNNIIVVENTPQLNILGIINDVKKYDNTSLFIIDAMSLKFSITNNYYKSQIEKGLKVNILTKNQWGSLAFTSASIKHNKVKDVKLILKELNNIDSLTWIESPVISNKHTIQVCYSGLSMIDCKKLSETVQNDCFGMDFSGIDSRGKRVMGLLPQGAIASSLEVDHDLLWPVPNHWTLAEAATVPLPYVHALYCLVIKSTLYKGSNVFVTGAAGALGQAVISIAQNSGCTIYATVSNADKKRLLLKLFPKLDEHNIGYNYDGAFRETVLSRTKRKLCSTVINCGSGMIREAAMSCVGFEGYFLNVNDIDCKENEKFGMSYLKEAKSYRSIDMSSIFIEKYHQNKKTLQLLLSEGIVKGFVRPLTYVGFVPTDICRAFRLLANRNNRGRVLINMKDPVMLEDMFRVTPRLTLSSTKTYIVVCDGTELSIDIIDRLIQRGARRLLMHCNPKLMSGYFHVKYASWINLDVTIQFNSGELYTELSCQNLIKRGIEVGPIDGIFIILNNQAKICNKIKIDDDHVNNVLIVSNLDKVLRNCCNLRYFAVIAVTSSNLFNENALEEIEQCCKLRQNLGLPSLFLRQIGNDKQMLLQSSSELFNAMELSLKQKFSSVLTSDSTDEDIVKPVTNLTKRLTNFNSGLETFYKHIIEDEFMATEPIIQMKTKIRGYVHEVLINPEDTYLMMIPGLDGNFKIFSSVSERLKIPAMALQLCPDINNSIPDMAKTLLKYVQMRFNLKSPFYIMGYSFGVNVALELAALLEKQGLVGVVYCLDSSPDAMRVHLDAYLGKMTDEQLQNLILEHIFKLLAGQESKELKKVLKETTNWSNKTEVFVNIVKNYVSYSHQYMVNLLQVAYDRIKMAQEYKPKLNLESELVLLKGIPHPKAEHLNDDYNLSQYTTKPVQVFNIDSDHACAPSDCGVSNFMNRTFMM